MTLVLQIENYDVLEDGGPVQFSVPPGGAQVGRSSSMDWVLPDPSRHISSHHFDIVVQNGAYWLRDVSTNGTFLQGSRYRLDGMHQLTHGDRFQVGQYFIVAQTAAATPASTGFTAPPQSAAAWDDAGDPWDVGGPAAPIDPLPPQPGRRADDFADDFIDLPAGASAPVAPPIQQPQTQTPAAPPAEAFAPPSSAPEPERPAPAAPIPSVPRPDVSQVPRPLPAAAAPPAQPGATPAPAAPEPAPAPAPVTADEFVRTFCEAAGLPADAYGDVNGADLAKALGETTRVVATELMKLLQARASAKQFTRGGERTMRRAADNNPLKFLPDADQAIEAMYLKHRAGFLAGADGVTEALNDIRLHQAAVFAAIQPALAQLLEGLSPEEIEANAGGGMLGSGKRGKSWDTFVERWDAKAHPHENGMLDEFLKHFAKAYADMVASEND